GGARRAMSRRRAGGCSRDPTGVVRRMARNDIVIVVVPGGMGTKLWLKNVRVWDFDPPMHLEGMRMIIDPALLVPWLPLKHGALLGLYDGLIKFFGDRGYKKKNDNLFLWGYDWRLGTATNAQALADFVAEIDLTTRKLFFVAHSCGC